LTRGDGENVSRMGELGKAEGVRESMLALLLMVLLVLRKDFENSRGVKDGEGRDTSSIARSRFTFSHVREVSKYQSRNLFGSSRFVTEHSTRAVDFSGNTQEADRKGQAFHRISEP